MLIIINTCVPIGIINLKSIIEVYHIDKNRVKEYCTKLHVLKHTGLVQSYKKSKRGNSGYQMKVDIKKV